MFLSLLPALTLPFLLPFLLAACAQLPGTHPEHSAMPRPARAAIGGFLLTGRVAVSQSQQRHAVNITWQHSAARDEILLATPLGQGIAELTRDARGAHLHTAERQEFNAPNWEELAVQVFGFPLPLSALPRWLLAEIPANALGVNYDSVGRPQRMVADGWQVAYLEYGSNAADALPALIELKRAEIEVRWKIDDWQLSP